MARPPFFPQRIALTAGVPYDVRPPAVCASCTIGNAGPDDLQVSTVSLTDYFVVPAGFERTIVCRTSPKYDNFEVAFVLVAVQDGTAVLIWV